MTAAGNAAPSLAAGAEAGELPASADFDLAFLDRQPSALRVWCSTVLGILAPARRVTAWHELDGVAEL